MFLCSLHKFLIASVFPFFHFFYTICIRLYATLYDVHVSCVRVCEYTYRLYLYPLRIIFKGCTVGPVLSILLRFFFHPVFVFDFTSFCFCLCLSRSRAGSLLHLMHIVFVALLAYRRVRVCVVYIILLHTCIVYMCFILSKW